MKVAHDPLVDPVVQQELQSQLNSLSLDTVDRFKWEMTTYIDTFVNWMQSSNLHTIKGLDQYAHRAYCVGSLEGIESFIHRHIRNRRIRFSSAEFVASKIVCNNSSANWTFLENEPLSKDDALVISLPFSGTGGIYPNYDSLMEQATELGVPVLLDLAYFGISSNIEFDLTWPCISDIVTSISKPFNVQLRQGIRFTREPHDDLVQVNSDSKIVNRIACQMAIELLKKFSHEYIISKYRDKADAICKKFNLTPTNTITLALGNAEQHKDFFRNGYYRVCITDELLENI